jgi:hypothetical protein
MNEDSEEEEEDDFPPFDFTMVLANDFIFKDGGCHLHEGNSSEN